MGSGAWCTGSAEMVPYAGFIWPSHYPAGRSRTTHGSAG